MTEFLSLTTLKPKFCIPLLFLTNGLHLILLHHPNFHTPKVRNVKYIMLSDHVHLGFPGTGLQTVSLLVSYKIQFGRPMSEVYPIKIQHF